MHKGFHQLLREYEVVIISRTLQANNGDKELTAKALQVSRRSLDKMLERHRLVRPRFARPLPIPLVSTDDDKES